MIRFNKIDKDLVRDLVEFGDQEIFLICNYLRETSFKYKVNNNKIAEKCFDQATKGVAEAQHVMAYILASGLMCKVDSSEALYWCSEAIKQKYIPSFCTILSLYDTAIAESKFNKNEIIDFIEYSASHSYIPAINILGLSYKTGELVQKDLDKSFGYYEQGASLGDDASKWYLSTMLLREPRFMNIELGMKYLIELTKREYPFAHFTLAYYHLNGKHGLEKDELLFDYHIEKEISLTEKMVSKCLMNL